MLGCRGFTKKGFRVKLNMSLMPLQYSEDNFALCKRTAYRK